MNINPISQSKDRAISFVNKNPKKVVAVALVALAAVALNFMPWTQPFAQIVNSKIASSAGAVVGFIAAPIFLTAVVFKATKTKSDQVVIEAYINLGENDQAKGPPSSKEIEDDPISDIDWDRYTTAYPVHQPSQLQGNGGSLEE
ncbi:MAG: hypothetical protein S4CHLAM81_13700 [Chlamydiales bacterium]|nr:hypothetical protein [Chlamydiales bacterium]MCH9636142.1 hypothetical protein [Chlamydiales bacterium]MCH9703253.1 hypothetical protein [Chlamydiota bacterium]